MSDVDLDLKARFEDDFAEHAAQMEAALLEGLRNQYREMRRQWLRVSGKEPADFNAKCLERMEDIGLTPQDGSEVEQADRWVWAARSVMARGMGRR